MKEENDVFNPPPKRPMTLEMLDRGLSNYMLRLARQMDRIEKKLDDLLYSEGKSHV